MQIQVFRKEETATTTIGEMFVDGQFQCYTLEDAHHEPKIPGKTRVPAGSYAVELRKEGGMVKKYDDKFPGHDGMLWLRNVPNFTYVYIHIGNFDEDTDGCLLVGKSKGVNSIGNSTAAYKELYPKIASQIEAGYPVNIEIV